jgi:hypothetical protein
MSSLYPVSVHTFLSKSRVTVAAASRIVPEGSLKIADSIGKYKESLLNASTPPPQPQKKKAREVRTGERGGQKQALPCQPISQ